MSIRYDVLIGVYREHREDFLDGIKTPEFRETVLKDEASDDNYSIFRLPWVNWDEYTSLGTKEILDSLGDLPSGEDFGEDTWFVYAMMEGATSADEVEVYGDPENFPVFISLSIGSELHELKYREKYNES